MHSLNDTLEWPVWFCCFLLLSLILSHKMPEYFIWGKQISGKEWANEPVLSCRTWQYRRGWRVGLCPSGASHILHSQILLHKSQTPFQPFPVRSNSFKQETCEKRRPTPICRYPNRFALAVFVSITIVGVITGQPKSVSVTAKIPAVSPLSQPLALRQFPSQT